MGCISEHRENFDTLRLTEVSLGSDLLLGEFVIFRTRIFALAACWTEGEGGMNRTGRTVDRSRDLVRLPR